MLITDFGPIRHHHGDNMEFMATIPDKYYDLAIVDPPYGIGATVTIGAGDLSSGRKAQNKWGNKEWDSERPHPKYFKEVQRVSKNQIIFGGNYFADLLPPSRCWIVWDKVQRVNQADAELAWTSFDSSVRVFQFHASMLQGFLNPDRFHPTEKPITLYKYLIKHYAKPNQKILDTHLGSASISISIDKANKLDKMGLTFDGVELDSEYYEKGVQRMRNHLLNQYLF